MCVHIYARAREYGTLFSSFRSSRFVFVTASFVNSYLYFFDSS